MWQLQVAVTGGAAATIATCTVGCTKTFDKPQFLLGSTEQLRSYKIPINAPSNSLNGKTVDVLMALVQAPHNQVVGVFAFGVSDFSDKHQADIINVLQALRPR